MRASRGEITIEEILKEAGLNFKEEYQFPDLISSTGRPLRFDFAVFDDNDNLDFLIEYQGIQHYQPVNCFGGTDRFVIQQKHDKLKLEYAKNHGYNLIAIPYTEDTFSKIKKYLIKHGLKK